MAQKKIYWSINGTSFREDKFKPKYALRELTTFLSESGFKKKRLSRIFISDGVKIRYKKEKFTSYDKYGYKQRVDYTLHIIIEIINKESSAPFLAKLDRWLKQMSRSYGVSNIPMAISRFRRF